MYKGCLATLAPGQKPVEATQPPFLTQPLSMLILVAIPIKTTLGPI